MNTNTAKIAADILAIFDHVGQEIPECEIKRQAPAMSERTFDEIVDEMLDAGYLAATVVQVPARDGGYRYPAALRLTDAGWRQMAA